MLKRFLIPLVVCVRLSLAQTPATEVSTQEDSVVFKSKVTLVQVPVVVRDKSGKPYGTLQKEDFQLFDKGKLQVIAKFSVEKAGGKVIERAPQVQVIPGESDGKPIASAIVAPDHFVGFLFDDVHVSFGDLVITRDAARKFVSSKLKPTDRAAIFTTSGQDNLDFTDDRELLNQTLLKLRARPIARAQGQECPDISFYQADQILNKHDQQSLSAATAEVKVCLNIPDTRTAAQMAQSLAQRTLQAGEHETQVSFASLTQAVHRMALMPGQRVLILASPGFLRLDDQFQDETALIDLAIRSGVTISALDARGLYTDTPDISKRSISAGSERIKQDLNRQSARAESDVLAELAAGTGGTFVENTNDLTRGFESLAEAPEVYYVLSFSPQNLKLDGSFHSLKVSVKAPPGLSVKARLGYNAPKHLSSADDDAKEEVSQALFSREEMRDIPVDIRTQFFKASESEAKLTVFARVDVRKLRFRKTDGRNVNDVLIVSALFDRNGNYVQSSSKTLKMKLLDGTLENKLSAGLSVRSEFKVAPGTYVIRLVVRDSEGQTMAATNGAVEIP